MTLDLSQLGEVERSILLIQYQRLLDGQAIYGKWDLDSKNNYYEAVMEILDRNNYMAAEELKHLRARESRSLEALPDPPPSPFAPPARPSEES